MLLGRLSIRGRLALLMLVPLIAATALTAAITVRFAQSVGRASDTVEAVRSASRAAVLVRALQEERLISVGVLTNQAKPRDLLLAQANTTDAVRDVQAIPSAAIATAVGNLSRLAPVRAGVQAGRVSPAVAITSYTALIVPIIDAVRLLRYVDGDTIQGRQVIALDAELHSNEGFATVLAALAASGTPGIESAYIVGLVTLDPALTRFYAYGTPDEVALVQQSGRAVDARLGTSFATTMITRPGASLSVLTVPHSYASLVSLTGVGRFIETKVINDALTTATRSADSQTTQAVVFVGLSLGLMVVTVVLGFAVARSVAGPVLRLTRSAEGVARLAEAELVRVADDDMLAADPVRLRPIEVGGRDELADFARAFGRVQETAARLVERQAASRRNVALMFGHVGRRTLNLVGRQVAIIDRLESQESDPERLADLYRLDHVASRLRRSASSLVVLSGATGADEHVAPLLLADVVRLALSEIEGYPRVDVTVGPVSVVPALINDLALLLAELMENAAGFSPPTTRVVVSTVDLADQLRINVEDHGLGMPDHRLAEENARFTRRERLDLVPTEVLGLFVVGRLARRHGLTVTLVPTPGGGVTAHVDVPRRLTGELAAPVRPVQRRPRGGGPALSSSGPARGEVSLLDRANRTMRTVEPWNAFGSVPRPEPDLASVMTPASVTGPAPMMGQPAPAMGRSAPIMGQPPSTMGQPPSTMGQPVLDRPRPGEASTLHRRQPGASLEAIEGGGRSEPVQWGVPSPAEARDSVEQFESGLARAVQAVQRDAAEGRR